MHYDINKSIIFKKKRDCQRNSRLLLRRVRLAISQVFYPLPMCLRILVRFFRPVFGRISHKLISQNFICIYVYGDVLFFHLKNFPSLLCSTLCLHLRLVFSISNRFEEKWSFPLSFLSYQ